MAVTVGNKAASSLVTSASSFTTVTTPIDVVAGKSYLCSIINCKGSNPASSISGIASGFGVTWTLVGSSVSASSSCLVHTFLGICTASNTGASWTVSCTAQTNVRYAWIIDEVSGSDNTVVNFVKTQDAQTSPVTVTLPAYPANSLGYSLMGLIGFSVANITHESGWALTGSLVNIGAGGSFAMSFRAVTNASDITPSFTFTSGGAPYGCISAFQINIPSANETATLDITTVKPTFAADLAFNGLASLAITTVNPTFAAELAPQVPVSLAITTVNPTVAASITGIAQAELAITTVNPTFAAALAPRVPVSLSVSTVNPSFAADLEQISQVSLATSTVKPTFVAVLQPRMPVSLATTTVNPTLAAELEQDTVASLNIVTVTPTFAAQLEKTQVADVAISTVNPSVAITLIPAEAASLAITTAKPTIAVNLQQLAHVELDIVTVKPTFTANLTGIAQASLNLLAPKPTVAVNLIPATLVDVGITTPSPSFSALLQPRPYLSLAATTVNPTVAINLKPAETVTLALTTVKPTLAMDVGVNLSAALTISTLKPAIAIVMSPPTAISLALTTKRPSISIAASVPSKPYARLTVKILTLIQDALTMLMVYSPDINLTAEEQEGALRSLNAIIESLANESLMMPAIVIDDYNLTGGKQKYTWEYGIGDFDSVRPTSLKACTVAISGSAGNTDFPVGIVEYDDWAAIKLKTLQTNYPQYVYIDNAYPAANVLFYPVPSSNIPVTFYSYKPSSTYKDVTLNIELPPGYYRMLVALLAIDLAPSYQLQASQNIFDIAAQAKRGIMRTNFKSLTMQTDAALMGTDGRYNVFSDRQGGR